MEKSTAINRTFTELLEVSFLLRGLGLHTKEIANEINSTVDAVEKHLERVNAFFAINNKRGIELSISTAWNTGLMQYLIKKYRNQFPKHISQFETARNVIIENK